MSAAPLRRVAVLDVGKTNVKAVLVDGATGTESAARTMPNSVLRDGSYPHFDTGRIEAFFLDALADLAREDEGFEAVTITAHGASGALLRADGTLALPVLDYEHDGPDDLAEDYGRVRPPFAETFSPRLPGGLNLGAQLFWQERRFPAGFADATAFLTYPQYWAHWLTGVVATEATSLGCHTDLWAPREGRFSSLVASMGWSGRMAPVRSAFDRLGPIRPALARTIGLARPVPVACGIHDSNASLLPHLRGEGDALSVVSTGTWAIAFAPGGPLDRLDPARDTLANVDAYGRPVPSARFMGGREFDILTGRDPSPPDAAAVRTVLGRRVMALPSFAPGSGPFPNATGRWSEAPDTLTPGERTAVATLYVALMTASCLDLIGAEGRTVVEGPFARNPLYSEALAILTGRPVLPSGGGTGTSVGAARLLLPAEPPRPPVQTPVRLIDDDAKLRAYAATWRAAI